MSGKRKKKTDPPDKPKLFAQVVCNESVSALPWESVLKDTNKAVAEAYILANLCVLRLCQAGRPIPVLDQGFYNKCLSAVTAGLKTPKEIVDEDLWQSVQLYKSWRDPSVPFASSAHVSYGWFQNASLQMTTNASSHIVVNFYRRFQKYIKQRFGITGKERYKLLRDVLAPTYEGSDKRVMEFRGWIPRNRDDFIDKDNPHLILPVTYRFLQFIEEENDRHRRDPEFQQLRSLSLLPFKRGFECSHFKMLFKIKKFETENRKFAGEMLTDGKAVSIVLRKPKKPEPKKSSKPEKKIPKCTPLAKYGVWILVDVIFCDDKQLWSNDLLLNS
ncbi:hypothetical protein JM18_005890 [Phytophthora kernoviae]|uniref:Uncharacterized protein n=1 Tax=Phytophthora kernoviae TaxID=325452 RepID=A0A921SFK8_9STRA|nr:hypothetical protein JM18_005890 [Phytophthora kernoviae]